MKVLSPMTWDPLTLSFKPRKAKRINKKAVAVFQTTIKNFSTESVESLSANKSIRLSNHYNFSQRLSMRQGVGKRPSRLSALSADGLSTNKKSCPSLKERLDLKRERELKVDLGDPQLITFFKYGMRRDYNEWSAPGSLGNIKLCNKKLKCSITIPANFSSNLTVNLPKDLIQWRLNDRIPKERKYVIYSHNLNTFIRAPFGAVAAFPDSPNLMFNTYRFSETLRSTSYDLTHHTSSSFFNLSQPEPVEKKSVAIQTEM